MKIIKAVLNIINANSNQVLNSSLELDLTETYINNYIEKQLQGLLKDTKAKKGEFNIDSHFVSQLEEYKNETIDFMEYSHNISKTYFDLLSKTDEYCDTDIIACEFEEDDVKYYTCIFISFKESYMHLINSNEEGQINNQIVKNYSILPNGLVRPESYFLIKLNDFSIRYTEHIRHYNGNEYLILSKGLLDCSFNISTNESISKIKKAVKEISKNQDLDTTIMLSKVENYIANVDDRHLSVENLTDEVFKEDYEHKEEFKKKIIENKIPASIKIETENICKKSETHKIKTDTGIEIKFPSEYSLDNDYINFKYNSDGTILIEIMNVTKIIN